MISLYYFKMNIMNIMILNLLDILSLDAFKKTDMLLRRAMGRVGLGYSQPNLNLIGSG